MFSVQYMYVYTCIHVCIFPLFSMIKYFVYSYTFSVMMQLCFFLLCLESRSCIYLQVLCISGHGSGEDPLSVSHSLNLLPYTSCSSRYLPLSVHLLFSIPSSLFPSAHTCAYLLSSSLRIQPNQSKWPYYVRFKPNTHDVIWLHMIYEQLQNHMVVRCIRCVV